MRDQELCRTYLLSNRQSVFLARAELEGPPDDRNLQLRITEGLPDDVVDAEIVSAVPMDESLPMCMGRVILRRGRLIVLEPIKGSGADLRRNLRMPVSFESLAYFAEGGRTRIRAANLSCGGIAFYAEKEFYPHERFEVVIPITSVEPSVLAAELLRVDTDPNGEKLYAAKFVDLVREEEARVREAVFRVQVTAPAPRKGRRS